MGRLGFRVALGCAAVSCAIAAALVGRRLRSRRQWSRAVELVREFEEACATPVGRLRQVVDAMAVEMHAGLASDGGSKLKMLLTFIDKLPDGYAIACALCCTGKVLFFSLLVAPPIALVQKDVETDMKYPVLCATRGCRRLYPSKARLCLFCSKQGAEVDVKRLTKRPTPPRFGRTLTEAQKAS
ncbi:hypothetical protein ZIOFF_005562 [Zingiber officinale]|uniref:Phosphotransferase n=1 Tax=Zingiber officinale TaxID=94328 RepID=A0A8J5HNK8_ZINOF|nr:hypothetical protein ZIOFF_005562 [Zingiber officinale]